MKNIYVCSKNFHQDDFETKYSILQPDGSYTEVERTYPKLKKEVVPRFLPGCPPHLSSSIESKPRRFDRAVKEQDLFHTALVQSREQFSLDEKLYQVTIIEDLISNVKLLNLPSKWIVWSSDNMSLHFVKPSITDHLISIRCSLTVTETLHIIGVYEGTKLTLSRSKIKDEKLILY